MPQNCCKTYSFFPFNLPSAVRHSYLHGLFCKKRESWNCESRVGIERKSSKRKSQVWAVSDSGVVSRGSEEEKPTVKNKAIDFLYQSTVHPYKRYSINILSYTNLYSPLYFICSKIIELLLSNKSPNKRLLYRLDGRGLILLQTRFAVKPKHPV